MQSRSRDFAFALSEFTASLGYSDIPVSAIREAKRRILDTVGCAIAAFESPSIVIARRMAPNVNAINTSTILGTDKRTSLDMATFINCAMGSCLDFNDGYHGAKEAAHPSDNIPVCLSVSDLQRSSGKDLLLSVVLAYEIQCRFADSAALMTRGWDQTCYGLISSTLAASRLLQLSPEVTSQALSIALDAHISLRQVRSGQVSMWRGCVSAEAARCAVFSTMLAAEGMTGPSQIFEGEYGFLNQVSGQFDLGTLDIGNYSGFKIEDTYIKLFPSNGFSQGPIFGALQARIKIGRPGDISQIEISTTKRAYEMSAKDQEKWAPQTRETADHSIPYTVAVALTDGILDNHSYDSDKLRDAEILSLMGKISVKEDSTLESANLGGGACRLKIRLKSGDSITEDVKYPRGHPRNPASDEEIELKFRRNVTRYLNRNQIDRIIEMSWRLDELKDIGELIEVCAIKLP